MSKLDRLTDDDIENHSQARIAEAVEEANRNTVQEEARLLRLIEAQTIKIETLQLRLGQLQTRITEAKEEANRNTVQEEARLLRLIEAQTLEIETLKLQLGRLQEIANIYKKIQQEHWADFQAQFKQA